MEPLDHTTYSTEIACPELPVLIVDDHGAFRENLAAALRRYGHRVSAHGDWGEVARFDQLSDLRFVIAGWEQGRLGTFEAAERLHAQHPDVPVVLAVDRVTAPLEDEAAARGFIRLRMRSTNYDEFHALAHDLNSPWERQRVAGRSDR